MHEQRCESIPLRDPDNPANTVTGLHYRYYEAASYTQLPNFSTVGPKTARLASGFDLTPAERADNYALAFDGYINVPSDGVYTFYTTSDDGSKLKIGGTTIVDDDFIHSSQREVGNDRPQGRKALDPGRVL